jgi:hypothetical protein
MINTPSNLDLRCFELTCEQTACSYVFKEVLRRFEATTPEIKCPRCGATVDIRNRLRDGDIRRAVDAARDLDAKVKAAS